MMGPTSLGHILRWIPFRGRHLTRSQNMSRERVFRFSAEDVLVGEALGMNTTLSTRERREAKCKKEDETQGPRDPAPRNLGRADTLTQIKGNVPRMTYAEMNSEPCIRRAPCDIETSLLMGAGGFYGGRLIREGSRGRGVCPTRYWIEDYGLIWMLHPRSKVVYQGRSATG